MSITKLNTALFVFLASFTAGAVEPPIDTIPMYGQPAIERPAPWKSADAQFIEEATRRTGSREKASELWWREAERYLVEGDLDSAVRRYNQAWLLGPDNYKPYWGFARVALERDQFEQAKGFFAKAIELCHDAYQRPAVLSDFASVFTYEADTVKKSDATKASEIFKIANQRYEEATTADPTYGNTWKRWAISLYKEGRFAEAMDKVRKAKANGASPFPKGFVEALESKVH